ncbi:cysteine-tryptophan domain-containing zinc finger protein 7-like [Hibiscus syriacus]|uniref:cysteine-tryptophan domain-containing zinc finger protein 7-like n=1 Tax=Hibiscus syriacus TaxID=106335 RepID=UPI0019213361|nr:cysteine-tryptophan domain-containing zinc finger protein 7-like [Hibiscus syriacus]
MDENSELEEGEAYFHDYEDDNINLDTAFSYIDEKIKNVLGHFQKDFEGGVSAENLGAKFGGYGSFLPTYEHSPPRLSCPKIPQKNTGINQQFFYGRCISEFESSSKCTPNWESKEHFLPKCQYCS